MLPPNQKKRTLSYPKPSDFPCFVLPPDPKILALPGVQNTNRNARGKNVLFKCNCNCKCKCKSKCRCVSASPRRSPHCNCTTLRCIHFWLKLTVADVYSKIKHAKAKCNNYIYEACWEGYTAKLPNLSRRRRANKHAKRSTVLATIAIQNTMNTIRFVSEYALLNLHMRSRIICKRGRAEGFGYHAPTRHIQAQFL